MIGVKLKINVWNKNIHLPLFEVGENLHSPFEISWIELLEREEAEKKVVQMNDQPHKLSKIMDFPSKKKPPHILVEKN